jgi:hypothetical protein
MSAAGQREGDGAHAIVTPEATIATNNERARCAQLVINFFLDAGADEAQAIAQPLVAAILRPTLDLSALPSSEEDLQCCMCGKLGLDATEGNGGTECELADGRWVCSLACYERAIGDQPTPALRDVIAERARQISAEGWTPEHDDGHKMGELARAAAVYAAGPGLFKISHLQTPMQVWPYYWEHKPSDQRGNLVKAGALILAEIERIDRSAASPDLSALPATADDYAPQSWDTSLRGKPEENGNG